MIVRMYDCWGSEGTAGSQLTSVLLAGIARSVIATGNPGAGTRCGGLVLVATTDPDPNQLL